MSATNPESVIAANKDALRASASASVAPSAVLPATAASSPAAFPSFEQELAAVKRRISDVEKEIDEVKENRKACAPGDDLWKEYTSELKQLRDELKRKESLLEQRRSAPGTITDTTHGTCIMHPISDCCACSSAVVSAVQPPYHCT